MKSKFDSHFIFAVCQVGAEKALKNEVIRHHPDLKFAYSRPGFLTFKSTQSEIPLHFELQSVFARAFGNFVDKSLDLDRIAEIAEGLKKAYPGRPVRLHLWERDFYPPGQEPLGYERGSLAIPLEKKIREKFPDLFEKQIQAETDDLVLDVILLETDQAWIGCHLHTGAHSPWPGGRPPLTLPQEAPSRAYLKIEEALLWSHAPIRAGDTAVEIGSAPGGASYALLKRGLNIVGIDPGKMDETVLHHPRFRHFQKPVNDILREDLPESIQWLLLDMNVEPRISLFAVDRLASRMMDSLLGIILTIKLNQWKIADQIPGMLEHVRAIGMVKVKAAQLSNCRQELMIYGLTRRGLTRTAKKQTE